MAMVGILTGACQLLGAPTAPKNEVTTTVSAQSVQVSPTTRLFTEATQDAFVQFSTTVFILWVNDAKSCRLQLVLPSLRGDSIEQRVAIKDVDPKVCGR